MKVITAEQVDEVLSWPSMLEAMRAGHRLPRPSIKDMLLTSGSDNLLVRGAWFRDNMIGVKAVTIFPDNPRKPPQRPSVQGGFILFDAANGQPRALIDGGAITAWKTAADSALGADLLARSDSETLMMIGAGAMAEPIIRAHATVRRYRKVLLWNRNRERTEQLAGRLRDLEAEVEVCGDLRRAMEKADVISSATMAQSPIIPGDAIPPGCHIDLVGAYRRDMREADDDALRRARIFVDSRETTLTEIGELLIPIESGVIREEDILGDLFDIVRGDVGRTSPAEITLFKNGGGAHLDLITAQAICSALDGIDMH